MFGPLPIMYFPIAFTILYANVFSININMYLQLIPRHWLDKRSWNTSLGEARNYLDYVANIDLGKPR